jgi:hypothetical protein
VQIVPVHVFRCSRMQVWETNVQQSINSVHGGFVTSLVHEEYVIQTYAGSILSFTSGKQTLKAVPGSAEPVTGPVASGTDKRIGMSAEVSAIEDDVRSLQAKVEVRRESCTRARSSTC